MGKKTLFKRSGDIVVEPGHWWYEKIGKYMEVVSISCPSCGRLGSLLNHAIAATGAVNPELECPYEDCDFRGYGELEDWEYKSFGS